MRNIQKNSKKNLASFEKILFFKKNCLSPLHKMSIAIFLMTPLFSCHLFNDTNTVASNENLGDSSYGNNDYDSGATGGIHSLGSVQISDKFVEGSKDIPLADGLTKVLGDGLDFDSASGSIIAVSYKSTDDLKKVKDFYLKTLPEFGWKNIANNKLSTNLIRFKRDNEKLEIEFINYNGSDLVKFFVETISR